METIEPALLWVAGICGAVATIWGLTSKIQAALTKPTNEVKQELKTLKDQIASVEQTVSKNVNRLADGDMNFRAQEEVNRHMVKSMSLLLKHCASGNHTGQLTHQAEVLDQFIVEKAGKL